MGIEVGGFFGLVLLVLDVMDRYGFTALVS